MKKFNWLFLVPTIVLFASPWMHRLIYFNVLAAWPGASPEFAHGFGIIGALIAFVVSLFILIGEGL